MKTYEEWGYSSTILNLVTRRRRMAKIHAPSALYPWKVPPIPTGYEAVGAPKPVWTLWCTEKSLAPARN
jgi:hypothetical protein